MIGSGRGTGLENSVMDNCHAAIGLRRLHAAAEEVRRAATSKTREAGVSRTDDGESSVAADPLWHPTAYDRQSKCIHRFTYDNVVDL